MRYLVDSDWLIDAAAGRQDALQAIDRLSADGLAISIVAVAEVHEGAFGTTNGEATLAAFREFLSAFAIVLLNDAIAERFARLRAALRQEGQLIADLDLLIAATALESDLALITRNRRHFARVPGLRLYDPN